MARRPQAFLIDLFITVAPWASFPGFMLLRSQGGGWIGGLGNAITLGALACLATLVLLVVQAVLFASRGKTIGMASVGLLASDGSRWLSLVVGVLLFILPALVGVALNSMGMLVGGTLAAVVVELGSALTPDGRTLSDRLARMRLIHDVRPLAPRRGAIWMDVLVLAMVGSPVVFVLDWDESAGAAVAGALSATLFLLLEAVVVVRTHQTIAMRALARPAK